MDRKQFIISSSITALGLSTFGSVIKKVDGTYNGDCETTNDILGPFYRPAAPMRSDLTYDGLKGTLITLSGTVFKSDCMTPLKGALIEIWHCDSDGRYDNDSSKFNQRASFLSDDNGEYTFKTIFPGKYLNGKLYRPAHIHYRVTAENSKELISQIYFKGDPHIDKDPWASKDKARLRVLDIIPAGIKGNLLVNFDIHLSQK